MTGLFVASWIYSLGPIRMWSSSGWPGPPIAASLVSPAFINAFQRISLDESASKSRLTKTISASAAPFLSAIERTGMGSGISHPAEIKADHKVPVNRNVSGLPSWYSIIAFPRGAFFNSDTMMPTGTPRGSCLFFTSSNCISAFAARSCCMASPLLNSRNCSACFSFMRSPRMSAAEPETTVRAMNIIVPQSAIAFHVSTGIENPLRRVVEKTRLLVGGLAFCWAVIAAILGCQRIKQLYQRYCNTKIPLDKP
jgi:hypothetical protein